MKNWKRLLALSLSGAMLAGALTACGGGSSTTPAPAASAAPSESAAAADNAGDPVNLVFSIAAVPTDAHGAAQKVFKETLETISGGNMTVECYDSGTLYGQDTEHDALKNGDVDMIYSSAS